MGSKQNFPLVRVSHRFRHVAVVLLLLLALSARVQAQPSPTLPTSPAPETVAIIDLRPGSAPRARGVEPRAASRRAFAAALAQAGDIRLIDDARLVSALAADRPGNGSEHSRREQAPLERTIDPPIGSTLNRARSAWQRSDCGAAISASNEAIIALAARQAAGDSVTADLGQFYGILLLCAHSRGDIDLAMRVRTRLERLGVSQPPPGVNVHIWNHYPAIDATTNTQIVELTIATTPPGAVVWLDHRYAGTAPVTVLVSEGQHLIAAAAPDRQLLTARESTISPADEQGQDVHTVALSLVAAETTGQSAQAGNAATGDIADVVAAWRNAAQSGSRSFDGAELGRLMTRIQVRIALILTHEDQVEMWAVGPGETEAQRFGTEAPQRTQIIASRIRTRVRLWRVAVSVTANAPGPQPAVELLRENPLDRPDRKDEVGQQWWVYAVIIGAVVTGAGLIVATQLTDDRQRIELDLP